MLNCKRRVKKYLVVDVLKKVVVIKIVIKFSYFLKEKSVLKERRSGLQLFVISGQSLIIDVVVFFKEVFFGFVVEMNKGFSSLGVLFKVKSDVNCDDNVFVFFDFESDDYGGGLDKEFEEFVYKK